MSVKFSSSDSVLQTQLSSINSSHSFWLDCLKLEPYSSIFLAFILTNTILLLTLCIFVLYHGLQRWRQQRSSSTATTTHSDSFTYHLVIMELICVIEYIVLYCAIYRNYSKILLLALYSITFTWYGETFFHLLTCVERYVAVVHPIIYLSLRKERGIRIRKIVIGCMWLLSFGGTYLETIAEIYLNVNFCLLIFSLIIITFCSLSVLSALIHPCPGEQGRDQKRVDQSKLRAFYTIMAILGVLLLRWTWNLVWDLLYVLKGGINECMWFVYDGWINLPSSLVLPLLFLQRAGKLVCCKNMK